MDVDNTNTKEQFCTKIMAQLLIVEEVMSDFSTGNIYFIWVAWQLVFVVSFVSIQSKLQGQYSQRILRIRIAFGEVIRNFPEV